MDDNNTTHKQSEQATVTRKKDPHSGIKNTQARGRDKVQMTLEWIGRFHFSVCSVLAKMLEIDKTNAHRMLKRLKDKQYIRGIEVPVIREEAYILTPAGLTLSAEFSNHPLHYHIQPYRLNISRLRHDLNVQIAILHRIKKRQDTNRKVSFLAERELDSAESTSKYRLNNLGICDNQNCNQKNRKVPDAIIIEETAINSSVDNIECNTKEITKKIKKTALEIELTPKADIHIYKGFVQHIQAMQDCLYDHVTYIFRTETMRQYYERRFLKEKWPCYYRNDEHNKWHRSEEPLFINDPRIRSKFSFIVEELYNG